MRRPTARSARGGHGPRPGERGSSLAFVLAIMVLAITVVAAVQSYSTTSLMGVRAYRSRTATQLAASDATNAAIELMRDDRSRGTAGSSYSATYGGASVTCTGEVGSGAGSELAGYADRTVGCTATMSGRTVLTARVRFFDRSGAKPGAVVEVLSWVYTP